MTDKTGNKTLAMAPLNKPMSMKLFASWEVDRSAPNCIPRLCSLRLTRLEMLKSLESDVTAIIIAVRMQSTKRTLRSNEIILPPGKLLETGLDLSFALQYPHFLKGDNNNLRIMLQRRKRYKNRTILGFKTLAVGQIKMSEVLQQSRDIELDLYGKDLNMSSYAKVSLLGLSSQPIDHVKRDRSVDVESEEEGEESYSSDPGENSDSGENMVEGQDLLGEPEEDQVPGRKPGQIKLRPSFNRQQRNIKKKFISLLKKFKVASDESEGEHFPEDPDNELLDEDFLYNDLDEMNLSDSGTDGNLDEISIGSTPKPVLRPYFSQGLPTSGSMADGMEIARPESSSSDSRENVTMPEQSAEALLAELDKSDESPPSASENQLSSREDTAKTSPKIPPQRSLSSLSSSDGTPNRVPPRRSSSIGRERPSSAKDSRDTQTGHRRNRSADRVVSSGSIEKRWSKTNIPEQLTQLGLFEETIPDSILFFNTEDIPGKRLATCVDDSKIVCTCGKDDVETTLQFIVQRLQKYCNQTPKVPSPVKIGICGNEAYLSSVMRPYVVEFSNKSPEWQSYVKFFYIPTGCSNSLAKYLSSVDFKYNSLFMDATWKEIVEKAEKELPDAVEVVNRLEHYLARASTCLHLPVGEVMVTRRQSNKEQDSNQRFIPFINYVRIGPAESALALYTSTEGEDNSANMFSSSPPTSNKERDGATTPPPSPSMGSMPSSQNSPSMSSPAELVELQVEYWPESGGKKDKSSIKTSFRSLTVSRLPTLGDSNPAGSALSMVVVTKDKNKKTKPVPKVKTSVMKIGKKSRDLESGLKSQVIDGIHRLVCTSRSQDYSLTVNVDGHEMTQVKFFQLSAQWQTHIKQFPIAVFGSMDPAC
ncbi:phosphofurin acidic cluster sorting protein 2-like isoform X3 [Apostichopus japonicus]|uniref:phosphofurin acidic cluster sorting protein 2-like isoform X3 n=1 Tax=Stichopus japonicus TaxID=307972 RepID=UPI003AB1FD5D